MFNKLNCNKTYIHNTCKRCANTATIASIVLSIIYLDQYILYSAHANTFHTFYSTLVWIVTRSYHFKTSIGMQSNWEVGMPEFALYCHIWPVSGQRHLAPEYRWHDYNMCLNLTWVDLTCFAVFCLISNMRI